VLPRSTAAAQTLTLARRHGSFPQTSSAGGLALAVLSRAQTGLPPRFESLPAAPGTCLGFSAPAAGRRPRALARHAPFVLVLPHPAAAEAAQIEGDTRGEGARAGDGPPTWGGMIWGLPRSTVAAQTLTLARRHPLFGQISPEGGLALVVPSRPQTGLPPRFDALPAAPGTCLGFCVPATGCWPRSLARHALLGCPRGLHKATESGSGGCVPQIRGWCSRARGNIVPGDVLGLCARFCGPAAARLAVVAAEGDGYMAAM
jgi:hypothetical protein